MKTPPTTVLLDIDGTLLDSNDAHASSWKAALTEANVDVPLARLRSLIGMGGDKLLAEVGLAEDQEPGRTVAERKKEIFRARLLPSLQPFHGTRALLERLGERGLALVAATSAGSDEVRELLERAGVDDLVRERVTADDVDRTKPDADPVRAALARVRARPEEAVLLGDTPYDLASARKARVAMIALRCGGWDFADGGPAAVYDDPMDLFAHLDESPLGGELVGSRG
jgi:HAD superfamily hydrolase (TIGR01509 family)